ncbi:hypothetical protein BKA57DRAFT_509459 [Linnemannia elongata]|nr:hypothetical protein BKA57DRAFT_509459 [Linnemannia elongata]
MRSIGQNLLVIHAVAAVIGVTTLFTPPRATTKYPVKLTDAGKLGVAMGELAAIFLVSIPTTAGSPQPSSTYKYQDEIQGLEFSSDPRHTYSELMCSDPLTLTSGSLNGSVTHAD